MRTGHKASDKMLGANGSLPICFQSMFLSINNKTGRLKDNRKIVILNNS